MQAQRRAASLRRAERFASSRIQVDRSWRSFIPRRRRLLQHRMQSPFSWPGSWPFPSNESGELGQESSVITGAVGETISGINTTVKSAQEPPPVRCRFALTAGLQAGSIRSPTRQLRGFA
jgi:hypothetical protein